jgi:hypothetical protein
MSEENQDRDSTSLTTVSTPVGTQPTLIRKQDVAYLTTNGQKVYGKILTGSQKVLFPVTVDMNSCFEYRFSFKNLMLPDELPKVTDMYFHYLTVKFQDTFTNIMSDSSIKDGICYTYDPYSAVICQDPNGLEYVEHYINVKGVTLRRKFISSGRVIQRDDNTLYVVSSNLKIEKQVNLTVASSPYKLLVLSNVYDEEGKFAKKILKSATSVTPDQLREVIDPPTDPKELAGRTVCTDVIICDVLIFMMKTMNLEGGFLESVDSSIFANPKKTTLPMGWLTPEEKLEKYGKKGLFMDTFTSNQWKAGDGTEQKPFDTCPNNLFIHVDMQEVCSRLFSQCRPQGSVFDDKNGIVIGDGIRGQYAIANEMISVSIKSDN